VIISLEEYNSLQSTQHEMSSKVNQQRLDDSIKSLKSGKKETKDLLQE
jgi:antitoxin YefM